jgi:hypothetical protein
VMEYSDIQMTHKIVNKNKNINIMQCCMLYYYTFLHNMIHEKTVKVHVCISRVMC